MDKLVDDGYTMNAKIALRTRQGNSAGGHLRGLSAPCCSTPRFLIVLRLIPVEDPA